MTFVVNEEALGHSGVKGMHWGVRKQSTSSGSPKKAAAPKPKLTKAQAKAIHDRRMKIGKDVAVATLAAVGALGVTTLAGPIAGAATGAAIRGAVATIDAQKNE